jgi:hypothetical protein
VLVHWVGDPVDARIVANSWVGWINENDFVILVCCVLVDPVTIEYAQVSCTASDTLFSNRLEVSSSSDEDTLVLWLSVNNSLRNRLLARATTNSYTVDDIPLLGLVP